MSDDQEERGGNDDPLTKWAIGVVLLALVALASVAISDSRNAGRETDARVTQVQTKQADYDRRLALLEYQYNEILKRLENIDRKVSR